MSADTKVNEEGGSPNTEVDIPLLPVVKTPARNTVILKPMEVHGEAETHLQPMEGHHAGASGCPKEGYDPMRSLHWNRLLAGTCRLMERRIHTGAGLVAGLVTLWGTHTGAACSWRTATCVKGLTLKQFLKNCYLWEGHTLEKFMEH
ncbi:hypothetical protein WISP_125526 [Willisornis vidua]|uniref:Uncharacterized protein n=1 Tax=Willisornis vidua TaxID=1566151 RepID=A0ABQ9CR84_9PASS|nr:hypothetical protein WISP_125526 [Willisornis vidua]